MVNCKITVVLIRKNLIVQIKQIPYNKSFKSKNAIKYIEKAIANEHISGNGPFAKKCHSYFNKYFSLKTLLTTSATSALEMTAILANIKPGDEVIMPAFTFVSTANAFLRRGAKIVFADVDYSFPNIDSSKIEELVTPKTKAIVPVHYAGVACDMNAIVNVADRNNIIVIEDAAQALLSYYKGKPLGSIGRFGVLSFHETKNITSGEGGLLVVRNEKDFKRAEILWEKGTNRSSFHRGEVSKYEWLDIGSSFLLSEINAALLYSQIEEIANIQKKRVKIWYKYFDKLKDLQDRGEVLLPKIPEYSTVNGHLFFMLCKSKKERDALINYLNKKGVQAVFHYLPLHTSPFFAEKHDGRDLKNTVIFSERIIRLPLFANLKEQEQNYIINTIKSFF